MTTRRETSGVVVGALILTVVLQTGCAARCTAQTKFLLDELTIVREELKKYPPQIRALEQQVRGQRRILHAEIGRLREQVTRLERRLAQPTVAESPSPPSTAPPGVPPGGIRRLGPDHYQVSRSALSRADLMRAARIVPSVQSGRPNGLKLFAIRPGSALDRMGLENGDTLLSINGQRLTSPDRALRIYSALRSAGRLSVELTRRGRPMTLRYTLVP